MQVGTWKQSGLPAMKGSTVSSRSGNPNETGASRYGKLLALNQSLLGAVGLSAALTLICRRLPWRNHGRTSDGLIRKCTEVLFVKPVTQAAISKMIEMMTQLIKAQGTVWPRSRRRTAFTLPEVLVGAFVLGFMSVSLFAAFSTGLRIVQAGRENARATQIMLQKMEAIRLLTWDQTTNTTLAPTNFTDWYDPTRTNTQSGGVMYQGSYAIADSPTGIPAEYGNKMRLATVTVCWTNYFNTNMPIAHSRQMQTLVARYGMQNYVNQ